MKIEPYAAAHQSKVREFLRQYDFNPLRNYRGICPKDAGDYFARATLNLCNRQENRLLVGVNRNTVRGMLCVIPLAWDTHHFGMKMAKLLVLKRDAAGRRQAFDADQLLDSGIDLCQRQKIAHLTCRIDIDDIATAHALEERDFHLMDTIVTYLFRSTPEYALPSLRRLHSVRECRESDLAELREIAKKAFTKDRFHLDASFAPDKADALYAKWIRSFWIRKRGSKILVACDASGRPRGFLAYQLNSALRECAGIKAIGRGLAAVQPGAKGAYVALVMDTVRDAMGSYDFAEFDTQLTNREVIRIYNKFGFRLVRSQHTFHKWL